MKKVISIFLVIALISALTGCAMGIGKTPTPSEKPTVAEPTTTEPPLDIPSENPNAIYILGLFYRTETGTAVLLSKDIGPLVLHNDVNDFDDIMDFAIIKAETELIMESYPAQTTIKNWGVTNTATTIDDWKTMVDEMTEMGYIPATPFYEDEEPEVIQLAAPNYDKLAKIMDNIQEENILFSPLSLNFALGMLSNSVEESHAADFENYFGMSIADYNAYVNSYMNNAQPEYGNTSVEIANGIWVRDDYSLVPEFENILRQNYDAEVASRAFDVSLIIEVNQWCAEKTHGMIPQILTSLPDRAASILANALYFNADWAEQYEEYQVRDTDFISANGETSIVQGLYSTNDYPYYENDHAVAFSKYYSDYRYSFVGILPKEEGDFTIESLDLASLMDSQYEKECEVRTMIPKFEFANSHEMLPILAISDMPIADYFYPGLVNETTLFVDRVIQKTAINVTESGTTAAAVTAIVMRDNAILMDPVEKETKEVILDRPFAFMIYDNETQTPLFVGKITNL